MTTHAPQSDRRARPGILFLCTHNAGRSQMAAAIARHLAGDRVSVWSGGSDPADAVNPVAVEAMREAGIEMGDRRPARWSEDVLRRVDIVVTMGCGDTCPVYPGKRYADWQVADPAGRSIGEVREIRDEIERRVRDLLVELGVLTAD